jgi:hypothetical protein
MMVITPKHVGAVLMSILMSILKLFLRQFTYVSVSELKNFDNIKMHGMNVSVKKTVKPLMRRVRKAEKKIP